MKVEESAYTSELSNSKWIKLGVITVASGPVASESHSFTKSQLTKYKKIITNASDFTDGIGMRFSLIRVIRAIRGQFFFSVCLAALIISR